MTKFNKIWSIYLMVAVFFLVPFASEAAALPSMSGSTGVSGQKVKLGVDNIEHYLHIFLGKRVGLITNSTGMNSNFRSTIDILDEHTHLVALFSPEHGLTGEVKAGDSVGSFIHKRTGLPVYSLYGATKKPTPEMIKDVDILVFDVQDVGARFYTYIYTMAYAMQSAKEQGKTFVVLDRPNPVGGLQVEGAVLKPGFESFIGLYPIPVRHGLTVGELALLFNDEFGIGCDLQVIKMTGWKRSMYFADTGLPWVMTSPNMPTPDTALVYSGIGILGGTNISEGVGTTRPFEFIGAPWLDADGLAAELNRRSLPGVVFRPAIFTPRFGLYKDEICYGVQLHVIDREAFRPVRTGITIIQVIRSMPGSGFVFKDSGSRIPSIDLITGSDYFRTGDYDLDRLLDSWEEEAREFKHKSKKYYLYS